MSESQQSGGSDLSRDSLVGTLIGGRYSVISRIAKGGTAVIYQARDTVLSREVAVKVLHEHLEDRQDVVHRLKREAQLIAQLRHPNILTVYDFIQDKNKTVLVVEFMPGTTLSGIVQAVEKIPEEYVLMITLEILQGLKAAHDASITHRDIKPANILVNPELGIKISDFGLAKILGSDDGLTKEGVFVGTPSFSSPEQIEGRAIDHRSDLFSLGLTMYMLATRTHAFKNKGDSTTTVWYKTVKGSFDPIRQRNASISPEFEKIVAKALQVDVEKRYASASAMIVDIEQLLRSRNLLPYKQLLQLFLLDPAHPKIGHAVPSKRTATWGLIGSAFAAMLLLAFFFLKPESHPDKSEPQASPETQHMPSEPPSSTPMVVESPQALPQVAPQSVAPPEKKPEKKKVPAVSSAQKPDLVLSPNSVVVLSNSETDWKSYLRDGAGKGAQGLRPMSLKDYRSKFLAKRRSLTVSNEFSDVDIEINPFVQGLSLAWPAGPDAASYRVEIALDETMTNMIFSGSTTARRMELERSWTQDQTLFWKVSYLDSQKNIFFVDRIRKANLKLRGAPVGVDMLAPQPGDRMAQDILISFLAPEAAKISCREVSRRKSSADFREITAKGSLFETRLKLSLHAQNILCRARLETQTIYFWLF